MYIFVCTLWILLSTISAEPTPQPSVEPSTAASITSSTISSSDLTGEGQDQVAILKQINRVNDDGSYTFGYEAADGSFKIETRDVAGNVKGMFGFVDEGGELKRVSYSASNGTGFQSTGTPNVPPLIRAEDSESTTRISLLKSAYRESTTRASLLPGATTERPNLPVYIYKTTTRAPRPEVIQHIPKLRPTPATFSTEPTESEEITNPHKSAYDALLPRKSSTPNYISLKSTTSSTNEEVDEPTKRPDVVQVIRPRGYKKIVVTKRPLETTSTPAATPVTYATQPIEDEVEENHVETQRQIDSNHIPEAGLLTSGTEDSPDVFGGGPTARPYPAGAYRTLFAPLPQYQRILQSSYFENQNQYGGPGVDPRQPLPPTGPGYNPYPYQGVQQPPINTNVPNRYQDVATANQLPQDPFPVPRAPPGVGSHPSGPIQYQGQLFPSGRGRPILPPPSGPQSNAEGPIDNAVPIPFYQRNAPQPSLYPGESSVNPIPATRPPPTLPTPTYNPSQGLVNVGPSANRPEEARRLPPPNLPQYDQAYPNVAPYGPDQVNPQAFLMEQLIRMLLAARYQTQPQQPLSPFQQALVATLGLNNVPQELLNPNYNARYPYQNYGPYSQRGSYFPNPPYDPRFPPYSGYNDPYAQVPYRYDPYGGYNRNPYPYAGFNPNSYPLTNPEEALLRMALGARLPPPVPQTSPQIQNSPLLEGPPTYGQQQLQQLQQPPPAQYGQRIPSTTNIVERASDVDQRQTKSNSNRSIYSLRNAPSQRPTTVKSKGSRNVQILEEPTSAETIATTSTPR